MLSFFGQKAKDGVAAGASGRVPRHSSGWGKLLERMRQEESLRILDIGLTSSTNINFVTSLGHSVYLANLVEEAANPNWKIPAEEGAPERFDVAGFLASQLEFSGRGFDIVLFWDTADYLPSELLEPVLLRIHDVMAEGGQMLAMFHSATGAARTEFSRYHLTDGTNVELQMAGNYPLLHTYHNRQIEKLLVPFQSFHFLLGKDNLREVLVTK